MGRREAVRLICSSFTVINWTDELLLSCQIGHPLLVKELLSSWAWKTDTSWNSLHPGLLNALKRERTDISEIILASVPVEADKTLFMECLYLAMKKGLWGPAKALLELGICTRNLSGT